MKWGGLPRAGPCSGTAGGGTVPPLSRQGRAGAARKVAGTVGKTSALFPETKGSWVRSNTFIKSTGGWAQICLGKWVCELWGVKLEDRIIERYGLERTLKSSGSNHLPRAGMLHPRP